MTLLVQSTAGAAGITSSRTSSARQVSAASAILFKMPQPIHRGLPNDDSNMRKVVDSLQRLGSCPIPVLRKVIQRVNSEIRRNLHDPFGNLALGTTALALTRRVLGVPESLSLSLEESNDQSNIYAISVWGVVDQLVRLDSLFPLRDIGRSRLGRVPAGDT